jgi:preprotein translocase subunit SecY
MFDITKLNKYIPTVEKPIYKVSINKKLMWTGIVLVMYFLMSSQLFGRVYGVAEGAGQQFQALQMLLGSAFGTLMTLGIGPLVTSSIILQLLVGAKIIDWDLNDPEQKKKYDTIQKLSAIALCFIEAVAFVVGGAVPPKSSDLFTITIVIIQLAFGGLIVILLDDIVSKWGIGSGISLFIAAGVARQIFIQLFSPCMMGAVAGCILPPPGTEPIGRFWAFLFNLFRDRNFMMAFFAFLPILTTLIVFMMVIYAQGISVDIPLQFAALRGFGRRWSLKLFYTSNIPVILTAALLANFQLFSGMMAKPTIDDPNIKCSLLGCVEQTQQAGNQPISGVIYYLSAPSNLLSDVFNGLLTTQLALRAIIYMSFMIGCSIIFSIFWVSTSGMDAESVAEQVTSIGMRIPGYRSNPQIVKQVLNKYIPALAVLGGASIGFLAAFADFTGAIGTGTGILLTVTIIYNFYEQLKTESLEGAHPLIRKFLGEE